MLSEDLRQPHWPMSSSSCRERPPKSRHCLVEPRRQRRSKLRVVGQTRPECLCLPKPSDCPGLESSGPYLVTLFQSWRLLVHLRVCILLCMAEYLKQFGYLSGLLLRDVSCIVITPSMEPVSNPCNSYSYKYPVTTDMLGHR